MKITWTPKYGEHAGVEFVGHVDASGYVHWDDARMDTGDLVSIDWLRKVAARGEGTLVEEEPH